jgi:hypothetical protein
MAYERELKFRVRLNLEHAQLLPVSRDGRDYIAEFSVHSVAGPRFPPVRGKVRVGVSRSLMAVWQVQDPLVEVLLNALTINYLISRIRDGALSGSEELQLTTYNALAGDRPSIGAKGPQLGPFEVEFSRWVSA